MTYEEALRWTDDSLSQGKVLPEQESYAYMGVVKIALEKQNPKMPVHIESLGTCIFTGDCPVCGEPVASYEEYCDKCGQALDWSDTK